MFIRTVEPGRGRRTSVAGIRMAFIVLRSVDGWATVMVVGITGKICLL